MADYRVLVTGSAGVIGQALLERLSERQAIVLSVDRLPLPMPAPTGVEHRQADLTVGDIGFIWDFRPRFVFHLAASFERAEETGEFWEPNWQDNVIASHRLAEGARGRGIEAFVFASSYLIYDPAQYLSPLPRSAPVALGEDAPVNPRNLCGAAKLYAEKELLFSRELLDGPRRVAFARIFRVFGRGSRDVISRWVRAGVHGDSILVYQPENAFDYIYAGDVADALIAIAGSEAAEGPINVATGTATRIQSVLDTLQSTLENGPLKIERAPVHGWYEASRGDISRLRQLTGWSPSVTLEDGIRRVIEHELHLARVG